MVRKDEIIIFGVAIILRMALFVVFALHIMGPFSLYPSVGGDSESYLSLAEGVRERGTFSYVYDPRPNSYEMPGYPLVLASSLTLAGSALPVIILQDILAGLVAVMLFRLGSFFSGRVQWTAALLFALDPAGIFYSNFVLTESLFIFLATAALFILAKSTNTLRGAAGAGTLLCCAAYFRAVGVVLAPFFVLFIFLSHRRNFRTFLAVSVLFSMCFLALLSPWLIRNKVLFGRWELSSTLSYQFYSAHAPHFYAYQHGVSTREAERVFRERLVAIDPYKEEAARGDVGSLRHAPYLWQVSLEYIREDIPGFSLFHILKTGTFFFNDGLRDIASRMKLIPLQKENIGTNILRGDFSSLRRIASENTRVIVLFVLGSAFWGVLSTAMMVGALFGLGERGVRCALLVSLALAIVVTAIIAGGAVSHPRYRFSVSPFIFLLAAYGIDRIWARLRRPG